MRDYAQETDEFKQVTVVVSFKYRHRDVTKATLREYLKDAIHTWGGQFDPGDNGGDPDPLFYGIRSITIGAIHDGDPKSVLVLLQADSHKRVGASKVRRKRGRRRSSTRASVSPEG